jgi:hypothetical protein
MAAGARSSNGERWIEAAPRFLLPVRALSTVLRGKCCAALAQAVSTGVVPLPEGFAQLRNQLYAKAWGVYAKAPFGGPAHVLDYVGRYTHRVAIAHHRLLDVRAGWVRFAYRNRRQGNRVQTMTLDADEFIRRFLLPVLPRSCQFLAQNTHLYMPLEKGRKALLERLCEGMQRVKTDTDHPAAPPPDDARHRHAFLEQPHQAIAV